MQVENLGRYRIVKELGRGAMGRVYLAHDPEIDRPVAIKAILVFSGLPEQEQVSARERFLREARSAGKLLHPGIVTIFDVGEADGVPYLAMEYVEGQTLDGFCRVDDLLPIATVVEIVANTAEALAYAHRAGIVHRDVKPANLMRLGETDVKIMDFGLAKDPATQLTHDGTLMGTPSYMSPEQVRGATLDRRSDLFSLGVVLYEMLTGEKPYGGESVSSVLYRIVHEEAPDAFTQRPSLPGDLSEFLRKALKKEPDDRFADGDQFAAALRRAAAGNAGPSSTVALDASASDAPPAAGKTRSRSAASESEIETPRLKRRIAATLLGLAGAAVAIAALGYFVFRGVPGTSKTPATVMLEARVRSEPAGVPVLLDGKPFAGDSIRFDASGPLGVLTIEQDCRKAAHTLSPADAGREIALVLDPVRADVMVDPGVPGARVRLNGADAIAAPARLGLQLCRRNVIEALAPGFHAASVAIPEGATPLEARTAAAELRLAAIPAGRLTLPTASYALSFEVDGRSVGEGRGAIDLPEGKHRLRATNDDLWIDLRTEVAVRGGETASPRLELPGIGILSVQAFPGNCKVYLRRGEGEWRFLDETPVEKQLAAGRYRVKVEHEVSGETKEQDVTLGVGQNPPLRFGFEKGGKR